MDGKESIITCRHLQIHPFNGQKPATAQYAALNRHTNRMRLERLPDDPPVPLEETIQNLQSIPAFVELQTVGGLGPRAATRSLALGNMLLLRNGGKSTPGFQFDITVVPAYRRQGLGREMLRPDREPPRSRPPPSAHDRHHAIAYRAEKRL